MSLNAVQHFILGQVSGLKSSYYGGALQGFIRPYVPGNVKLHTPHCYVWGSIGEEKRTTIPRGTQIPASSPPRTTPSESGWREAQHTIHLWLIGTDTNNDPHGDEKFPILQETVKQALRSVQQPAYIVDPTTADWSYLMDVGETMSWEYDVDRTTGDQRLLRSAAVLRIPCLEMFKG